MLFCGLQDIVSRVKKCHFSEYKGHFVAPKVLRFQEQEYILFMSLPKSSFCGCKDIILWLYRCHFVRKT